MLQLSCDSNYGIITSELVVAPSCFIVNCPLLTNEHNLKRVIFCKKVSFDTFNDIIYIPKYNTASKPYLWWSMRELEYIRQEVKKELRYIMKTSLITMDIKCALRILCQ
jgi:hypothetical protein